jgi:2-polyprenyl-6-methoxyphenol hydroxylase-like FAD-dependent oxidoreductase
MNMKYAPTLGVTREGLMDGLLSGLRAQIQLSTTIAKLERLTGAMQVTFSDGTQADYEIVVGADGIKSRVRSSICPHVEPVYRSFCAWRTLIECHDFESDRVVIRLGPGCVLGTFKVAADILYAFVLAHEPRAPSPSADHLEQLKELARRFRGRASSLISRQRDPDRVIFVPVHEVDTVPYHRGRVVLIGDAAHAFVPQFAQGAAMAIEDGVVLSQLLGSGAELEQALASYEATRRRRIDLVRAQVRHRAVLQGMEGPVTPELLKQHPPCSPNPEAIYENLLEGAL